MIRLNSQAALNPPTPERANKTNGAPAESGRPHPSDAENRSLKPKTLRDKFHHFSHFWAGVLGSAWAFVAALLVILVWAVTGPIFGFSDTWQLVINTGTTIVTFLMVFLIQNTQNRDARALHLKLDELLRAITMAHTNLVDLENLSEEELDKLELEFKAVRERECQES